MKTVAVVQRVLGAALAGLFLTAGPAQAQDKKVSLYAGYAFLETDDGNLDSGRPPQKYRLHGGRVSPEYRLNGLASIVGDFSMEKGTILSTDTTIVTYLGGVRLKRGVGAVSLFVHALAGGVRTSSSISPISGVSVSVSDNGLGLDGGGGVEFKLGGSLKLRVGADYLRRKIDVGGGKTENQNDIRATVGVVF